MTPIPALKPGKELVPTPTAPKGDSTAWLHLQIQQLVSYVRFQKRLYLPLPIQVLLFHDQNYGIHYEYTIPVNHTAENQSEPEKPQDSLFLWTHSGWEECSVQCGGGERDARARGAGPSHREAGRIHVTGSAATSCCRSLCRMLESPRLLRVELCPPRAL